MKDTLRLLITMKCNFKCKYCCNEIEEFNSKFIHKELRNINFSDYKSVCITGGEPFINTYNLYYILLSIPANIDIYIYTNGVLITEKDISNLEYFDNIRCLNIGLHSINQLDNIIEDVGNKIKARFHIQDIHKDRLLSTYPNRVREDNIRVWTLNDCNMPNEDWVVLEL